MDTLKAISVMQSMQFEVESLQDLLDRQISAAKRDLSGVDAYGNADAVAHAVGSLVRQMVDAQAIASKLQAARQHMAALKATLTD